ncbi:MAG: T9SS type A sorting domain-containing protein [Flavobacteriales bacterium]|nr:T9SS type A sorting domain-containing protein [Flavobacteriales bacterium]
MFSSSTGTYTPITGGTQILAPNTDTGNSPATNIGFSFLFNGTSFTQFVANSNGNIRLGSSNPTSGTTPISTTSNTNAIAFAARDGGSGSGVFTVLEGTAPNRVCVIEYPLYWVNWSAATNAVSVQIRLYETTNVVEVKYSGAVAANAYTVQVGMRGGTGTTEFNNRTTTTSWAATTAGTAAGNTVTWSATVLPPSGLTYTWTPPAITDVAASTVSGSVAGCPTASDAMVARVNNSGTLPIDLSVQPVSVSVAVTGAATTTLTGSVNTGTLAVGGFVLVPLTPSLDRSAAGTYTYASTVTMTGDFSATNNTANSTSSTTALYAVPQTANFTGFSGTNLAATHPGFDEFTGTLPTTAGSAWTSRTATFASNTTAVINLYLATRNEWIVMPKVTLGANDRLTFKAAITEFFAAGPDASGGMAASDDRVVVRISTNCGVSFTDLLTINAANLQGITSALTEVVVPLSSYAGQTVVLAIYAADGPVDDAADYDFHIDDLSVAPTPQCFLPTVGTPAPALNGFSMTYTLPVNSSLAQYEVRTSGAAGSGATGLATSGTTSGGTLTVNTLSANTTYTIYLRSDCAAEGFSAWTSGSSVYTGYCVPNTATLDPGGITNVTFSNVNNSTGPNNETGGYADYTSSIGYVAAGQVVPVSITYETGFVYGTTIWVDWDNDVVFESGEQMFTGLTSSNAIPSVQSASITVPPGQAAGNYRMRIYGADFNAPTNPCLSESYIAVEDYTIAVCATATATIQVNDNCAGNTFTLEFTASSLSSGTVSYTVNGGAVQTAPLTGVGTSIGPFADIDVVDVTVNNGFCSTHIGNYHSACPIDLDCGAPAIVLEHCYTNNDTRTWTFTNPDPLGTVAFKFLSGSMESNDNVRFWNGAPGSTPATPASLTGSLTSGGVITSSGNTFSVSILSDGSNSCADGGSGLTAGWEFQVRCGGCVEPTGYVSIDENEVGQPTVNCTADPATFSVFLFVEDFGIDATTALPATTVGYNIYVNNVLDETVTGLDANDFLDWLNIGSYPLGTLIDVQLLHGGQSQCNVQIADNITVGYSACPPANDACANATTLNVELTANCPANAVTGTTLGADQSGAQPTCATGAVQDVWYTVNTTGFQMPVITVTDGSATVVGGEIYTDCLTPYGACVADMTALPVNWNLPPGIYYLRLFTTVAGAGNFTVCMSSAGAALPGDYCGNAINLGAQTSPVSGSTATAGLNADYSLICGSTSANVAADMVYYIDVPAGAQLNIAHASADYDSQVMMSYGATCPGDIVITCWDDADDQTATWTNTTGSTQRVWWVQDGYSAGEGSFTLTYQIIPACAGTPNPGNTLSSAGSSVCSGRSFTLSLQNTISGAGVSYQWESSTDGGGIWAPVGTNAATFTTSITVPTMFRAQVTCTASASTGTSTPISLTLAPLANCPCLPVTTYGCADGDVIARVTLNTLDNNSGTGCPSDPVPGNTSVAGGEGPGYSDYTGNLSLTTTLNAGTSYSCTVYAGEWSEGYAAWIDYNDDGQFDNLTERIGYSNGTVAGSGVENVLGSSATFPIVLGCSPPVGQHRLRVRAMFATNGIDVTACGDNSFGEVEDYLVTVAPPPPCPSASGLVASNTTASTVDLDWAVGCTETAWVIEYGVQGFTLGTGTTVPVSGTPETTLTDLFAGTAYSAYVRADCGVSGTSSAFGPINFRTSPANDECLSATVLTVNSGLTCTVQTAGSIQSATASVDAVTPCFGTADDDVWYQFVATSTSHTISLNNVTGSTTDLYHAVYSGTCGSLVNLLCSDPNSSLVNGLTVGDTYYVRVYTWTSTVGQTSAFSICIGTPPPAPINDACTNATVLTVNPNYLCGTVTAGTVAYATPSGNALGSCFGGPDDDVWYRFTATHATHRVSLLNVAGSVTDMYMKIYRGADCSSLVDLACSDPNSIDLTGLTVGEMIYVRVYTYTTAAPQTTTFSICIGAPPPPPANDNCAGAASLVVNTGLTCAVQTAGTLQSATDSGVPVAPCAGGVEDDVWYSFVAGSTQQIITLSSVTPATTMRMQLFSGACGALTSVACGTVDSYTTPNTLVVGDTYYVRVYSNGTTAVSTNFNICVTTPPVGPPANDNCAGAVSLTVNAGQVCTSQTFGSVFGATASGQAVTPCAGTADDDVWFSFVATGPTHTVALNSVAGSVTSMNFNVFSGACGTLTNIGCGTTSTAVSGLVAGNTYYVRVYTNTATVGQNTTFNVCVTSPPANDLCANAILVDCNSVVTGSTVGATNTGRPTGTCTDAAINDPYVDNAAPGVWYRVIGWGGQMKASLCGSTFDSQVGVFSGSCGTFTCVAGNDDAGAACPSSGTRSVATWNSVAGTTYYIYVTAWGATTTGDFTLTTTCGATSGACTGNGLTLEFQNAANPNEITWEVVNESGTATVLNGTDAFPANSIGTQGLCLPDGCYRLRILDSGGDGMVGGTTWPIGGYTLRTQGSNLKIIDNQYNFNGVFNGSLSAIANGGTFCVPVGTDRPIYTSCDKLDWVNDRFIVATENTTVSGQYGVTNATSGYEFWFFDPNGSYSFRRFRSHATSDGTGTGALRACHFRVNAWVNSVTTPHLPASVLLNVRVRGRVANVNLPFGPACLFKIDPVRAACPLVKLQDNPGSGIDLSCGVSKVFGGANSTANKLVATPPQPVPTVASANVRYQFRFRIPGEYPAAGSCIVRPIQTSPTIYLNWTTGDRLKCNTQYDVDVRVSLDGGATWCVAGTAPTCAAPQTIVTWGKVCKVNVTTSTFCPASANGGASSMNAEGNGEFTMYPNPNRGDQLFLSLTKVEGDVNTVSMDVFDMTGKRVMARTIAVQDGFLQTAVDLNGDLAGGMYMVNITAGDKTYTERLVIQP